MQVFIARHAVLVSHAVLLDTMPPGPNVKFAEQLFNDTARKDDNDLKTPWRCSSSRGQPRGRAPLAVPSGRAARGPQSGGTGAFAGAVLGEAPRSAALFPA